MNWGELKKKAEELKVPDDTQICMVVNGMPTDAASIGFDSRISSKGTPTLYVWDR